MVRIGHHLLAGRLAGPRRVPVQLENRVEPALMQQVDIGLDRGLIGRAGVRGIDAVDVEPAIFVQRNTDHVDVPGRHRGDRGGVVWTIEDAPALDAGVFRARTIDAEQADRRAVAVDQMVGGDADRKRCGRHSS